MTTFISSVVSNSNDNLSNPTHQMIEPRALGRKKLDDEMVRLCGLHIEPPSVESKKDICGEEGHPLVAIDKGMIDEQRFEERGRHGRKIFVIA